MTASILRRNPDAASFEDFGDEVVVIHNESGVFYSIKGRAMALWRALEAGVDAAALDAAISALDAAESSTLRSMVDELSASGVVVASADAAGSDRAARLDLASEAALGAARFESNSDFDDLIRLDPIHDVGDAGWPQRREGGE